MQATITRVVPLLLLLMLAALVVLAVTGHGHPVAGAHMHT